MAIQQNNIIRFLNISRKKEGLFANFRVKGERNGATFSAALAVDLAAAQVDPADPLETIIEECARIAVKEFQKSDFQFEGLASI